MVVFECCAIIDFTGPVSALAVKEDLVALGGVREFDQSMFKAIVRFSLSHSHAVYGNTSITDI